MPIPILLGLGVVAGVTGVAKAVGAKQKNDEAKDVNEKAKHIYDNAKSNANKARQAANEAVKNLGQLRIDTLQNEISQFMNSFNQIHHLEASFSKDFGGQLKWNKEEYLKMKELETLSFSMASGAFKGSAAGAVTAFGAYGGAMTFGAASTGTAIASLSGAAATNATLAFLGGGSLAAGGLGVAGGTMVLGGLVAGPALAVLGFTLSAKASANLDNARSNLAKAREIAESLATVRDTCYHIRDVAQEYAKTLRKLRPLLASLTEELQQVIRDYGTDYRAYSTNAKHPVAAGMAIFQIIAPIIGTAIITKDGAVSKRARQIINGTKERLTEVRQLL